MTNDGASGPGSQGVTIGELAAYAGVTVRTVRHYHQLGLLPEPGRDELGHRRYDAAALLRLRDVIALARAGVPLRRVGQVLEAEPRERAAALEALDAELARRQAQLSDTRNRLADLRRGTGTARPPGLDALERRLAHLGLSPGQVAQEREMWLLSHALYPDLTTRWIEQQLRLFDDATYAALYREVSQASGWSPDDPRLDELARRNVDWTLDHLADFHEWSASYEQDPRAAALMEAHFRRRFQSPAHRRLQQLVQRGLRRATAHMPSENAASRSALE